MLYNYKNIPFGAQILIWTSRLAFHGSCRHTPNKYELIEIAYKKVGIFDGHSLLKNFLCPLKNNRLFKINPICNTNLIDCELNLINCVQEHKKKDFNNKYFIKLWALEEKKDSFTLACNNLSAAFTEACLITDLLTKVSSSKTAYNYNVTAVH